MHAALLACQCSSALKNIEHQSDRNLQIGDYSGVAAEEKALELITQIVMCVCRLETVFCSLFPLSLSRLALALDSWGLVCAVFLFSLFFSWLTLLS